MKECHACHAKRHVKSRWMSPSATPATQKCRGVTRDQAGPSAPPSAMSATPATQNDRGCEIAPRLPREIKVDVTKCHACHARVPRRHARPSGPKRATQCHECHACHAKRPWMPATQKCRGVPRDQASPSAPPRAMSATPATQNDRGCEIAPRLPREIKVDVTKRHACHAKVPRRHSRPSEPKRATQGHECHACHAKRPWM